MQFERFIGVIDNTSVRTDVVAPFNTTAGALFKVKDSDHLISQSAHAIAQSFSKAEASLSLDADLQHYDAVSTALQSIFHHETIGSPSTNSPEKFMQWSNVIHAIEDGRLNPDGTISKLEFTA